MGVERNADGKVQMRNETDRLTNKKIPTMSGDFSNVRVYFSTTASTSFTETMRCSSPSIFTSVPPYRV